MLRDRSIEIRMRVKPSRPLAGVGACQAHPNSSVNFSDEPDELG